MPATLKEAWGLGQLECDLRLAETIRNNVGIEIALARATAILGQREVPAAAEFHEMARRVATAEAPAVLTSRIAGFFSFVNLLWFTAILGASVATIPVLYLICGYLDLLGLVITTAKYLHENGILAFLGYTICAVFCIDGVQRPPAFSSFISLTGLALAISVSAYTPLVSPALGHSRPALASWAALCFAPLAVAHESPLLAFGAVAGVFAALGFSVVSKSLCLAVGFESTAALGRAGAAAFVLLAAYLSLRTTLPRDILAPFAMPVQVWGTLVLFLAELIASSRSYSGKIAYLPHQALMIALLLGATLAGAVLGLAPLFNTACVFWALYCAEKIVDLREHLRISPWPLLLGLSVALWAASAWLHSHPAFVGRLFEGF
jgi:hypothetical protein